MLIRFLPDANIENKLRIKKNNTLKSTSGGKVLFFEVEMISLT